MFTGISIHLTEPICTCQEQKLAWAIQHDGGKLILQIFCKECNVLLQVPHEKLMGTFVFETPHPVSAERTMEDVTAITGNDQKFLASLKIKIDE